MAKFHGRIGFLKTIQTSPGVWTEDFFFRVYTGDKLDTIYKWQQQDKINEDLNISVKISILCDSFINENYYAIKCVEYGGALWRVTDIQPQRPRIILTLGGLYNENSN